VLTRGTGFAPDWTYIGGIVTVYLVSIIPTIYFYDYVYFFIPSYRLWRPGTLDYS
jgi:hypothetical protein